MGYELCTWGFIVGQYVTISTHPTREEAYSALKSERAERETRREYTDMGTFKVAPVGWRNFSLRQREEHGL